jgi:tRNA (cmo5U34)-methyltransferase
MNDKRLEKQDHSFSFSTIENFDDHINQSIPHYDTMNENIVALSEYFIDEGTNVYDIGCSTGKLLRRLKEGKDDAHFYGLEINENMIKEFTSDTNLTLINSDITKYNEYVNASLITSIFTLQFVPLKDREKILKEIYKGLNKGGAFIFSEKVLSRYSKFQDIFTFLYYDFKKRNFSEKEILDKEVNLRSIMKPITLEENIQMLKKVGFKDIDVIWKNYNFVNIIAIK